MAFLKWTTYKAFVLAQINFTSKLSLLYVPYNLDVFVSPIIIQLTEAFPELLHLKLQIQQNI